MEKTITIKVSANMRGAVDWAYAIFKNPASTKEQYSQALEELYAS